MTWYALHLPLVYKPAICSIRSLSSQTPALLFPCWDPMRKIERKDQDENWYISVNDLGSKYTYAVGNKDPANIAYVWWYDVNCNDRRIARAKE
jgi:hypothetical protein